MIRMTSPIRLLPIVLLLAFTAVVAEENATDHFLKGRKLLEEKNYTAALEEFQKADALKPNLPEVQANLGASLNALGKFAEAKEKLMAAFRQLQTRPKVVGANWGPIDIGYYALLADIQANLGDVDGAVETVGKYTLPDTKTSDQARQAETLAALKKSVSAKIVNSGLKCLGTGDTECATHAFAQAEKLQPATPEVQLAIARAALSGADRMAATTDEEKAKKAALSRMGIEYVKRLPASESDKPEAKRLLAKALTETKKPEDYQQGIKILSSLWDASAAQPTHDTSILLDLTTAYLNGDDWENGVKTASKYIEVAPEDARAQGYCKRSFAYYRLGQYQSSIEDGAKCTNSDGSPRQLKHVELARLEIQRQKSNEAVSTAQKEAAENECKQLNKEVEWARSVQNPDLSVLVPIIARLDSNRSKCKRFLDNPDATDLCRNGIFMASNPANLSAAKPDELKELESITSKFLKLCEPALGERQKADVRDALRRISGKPAT